MADDKIITEDDEIEIVEVETLPKPGETVARAAGESEDTDAEAEGESEETEDARLVDDDDEDDEESVAGETPKQKAKRYRTRAERRKTAKVARDRLYDEVERLRLENADFHKRFSSLETNVLTQNESQIDERLSKTREDIGIADRIMAKAMEAGNGEDFIAAQSMRDAAKDTERELLRNKGTVTKVREGAPNPAVARFVSEFKTANASWYGVDPNATAIANRFDTQVANEGYDPASQAYWNEVARRTDEHFRSLAPAKREDGPKKKTVPPQGQTREHAPQSTRREVYVTPERKQAMVDAGIWDDPTRRAKMLKQYADYDREQSA